MTLRKLRMHSTSHDGFAAPSILITSVVMLVVLVSAATAVSAIRVLLDEQTYKRMAQSAAESGVTVAEKCIRNNAGTAPWSSQSKELSPATNCSGDTVTGRNAYVVDQPTLRTTFTVGAVNMSSTGITVNATSKTELIRNTDGRVWRTYTQSLQRNINFSTLIASTSAVGRYQVCGIIDAKTWCWGHNESGQLGNGRTTDSETPVRVQRLENGLGGKVDTDVAVGDSNACVVSSGEVYCWGYNGLGALGNGTTSTAPNPTPRKVQQVNGLEGRTATQVVMNGKTTCVLASGDVFCWGAGSSGILGNGSSAQSSVPKRVSVIGATNGMPVTKIALTPVSTNVCAIASGKAYCWGQGSTGQNGDNSTTNRLTPVPVYTGGSLSGKTIVDIALDGGPAPDSSQPAGDPARMERGHVCVVTSDGQLHCWGANAFGQLGQGSPSNTPTLQPVRVLGLLNGKTVTRTATSYSTSCAVANGEVYCWGYNFQGQMGDNTTVNKATPTKVYQEAEGILGKTITDIVAGVNRTCVIASGTSYCWGLNTDGQIGDGTFTNRKKPTEALFLKQNLPSISY